MKSTFTWAFSAVLVAVFAVNASAQNPSPPNSSASTQQSTNPCQSTGVAYFPEPPVVGRRVLSGCAGTAPAVRVVVYKQDKVKQCPTEYPFLSSAPPTDTVEQDISGNVNRTTGVFSVELDTKKPKSALKDNELVCVWAIPSSQNPPVTITKWGYEEADSPRGRTRFYLSTGVALAQDNQQFSNQDIYLGLDLNRNWLRGNDHALLYSEFSAQLTSIPVAASGTTTTNTSSSTPSSSTFISSRKAGVVGGSVYAPLYADAFKGWFGGGTTAFIAPIITGGLQTITTGSLDASAPSPGTVTTTATVNGQGLYYFWSAGIRLGDLKLYRSWNIAPEMLSHLDITVGQWQNFQQCRTASNCTPGTDGAVPANQLYQPLLLSLAGKLDIPKTPVQIGFSSITPLHGGGKGDLRFFFGVKLDIGCLYKSFKGGSTPKFFDCTDDQLSANNTTDTTTPAPAGSKKP
jgi:hypothetical protein